MTSSLLLADADALADLATFVARARLLDADGAVRLQAQGMSVAAYVGVLPGHGLMSQGAVIGLRVMPLAEPGDLDVTVSLASLTDRFARRGATDSDSASASDSATAIDGATASDGASGHHGARLAIPPTTVSVGWAAMAPPRRGWEPVGSIAAEALRDAASDGIEQIAHGAPAGSGGHAVAALRLRVWARQTTTVPPVSAGAAFAAYALGFLRDDAALVFANGRWTRLTTSVGHVLVR